MPISRDMAKTGTIQPFNIESTFSRTGNAYDPYGVTVASGVDRHSMLVPTGTVTNLLTGTQSDGGDTNNPELLTLNQQTGTSTLGNTTGFTGIGTTPASISSSEAQAHTGTKSLAVDCSGSDVGEGVKVNATTVANATVYIAGVWVWAPQDATLEVSQYSDNESTPVALTGNNAWQYVEVSDTTGTTTNEIWIKTKTSAQDITFYVDDCRLGKTDTTGYTATGSTISITPYDKYQGLRSLKVVTNNAGTGEGVNLTNATVTSGKQNTGHIAINAPVGAGLILRLYDGSTSTDQAITGTGAWQIVEVNKTPASTTLSLRVLTSSQQGITFYVDTLMIGVIT